MMPVIIPDECGLYWELSALIAVEIVISNVESLCASAAMSSKKKLVISTPQRRLRSPDWNFFHRLVQKIVLFVVIH
jgi:hypothetical protein